MKQNKLPNRKSVKEFFEPNEKLKQSLEYNVTIFLFKFGICPNNIGFHYIRYAILHCVDNIKYMENMNLRLFPMIAYDFQTTKVCVNRALRASIIKAQKNNPEMMYELTGSSIKNKNGVPTVKEFIVLATYRFKEAKLIYKLK